MSDSVGTNRSALRDPGLPAPSRGEEGSAGSDLTVGRPRLSEVLRPPARPRFATLATLPSNTQSVEAAMQFSTGALDFVALVGPSGCGKSHLLGAAAERLSGNGRDGSIRVVSAAEWVQDPRRRDTVEPLLLDNVQDVLALGRQRQALSLALERRVRFGRPTMLSFTYPKLTRQVRTFLPSPEVWAVIPITLPQPAEREDLVRHLCRLEGMTLAPGLVWQIAHAMHGNGQTICGTLKRLKLNKSEWCDSSSQLLAMGILSPFFADNGGWDLRQTVAEVADAILPALDRERRVDLAIYVLLGVCSLPEVEVAAYFGITPRTAYQRYRKVLRGLPYDADLKTCVDRLIQGAVQRLCGSRKFTA
ncbi:MAG: hypothetical protein ACK4XJ_06615 [Fimbriimonadaceae bacterium]